MLRCHMSNLYTLLKQPHKQLVAYSKAWVSKIAIMCKNSPCTSRCSCTIRDLYSSHFSCRVCWRDKRHSKSHSTCHLAAVHLLFSHHHHREQGSVWSVRSDLALSSLSLLLESTSITFERNAEFFVVWVHFFNHNSFCKVNLLK